MNDYRPHLLVLSEDQANIDLVNGYLLHDRVRQERIQVLKPAGGWKRVREVFGSDHVRDMRSRPERRMLLVVDFDGRDDRLAQMQSDVPTDLMDRVFVLGTWTEPEDARRSIGQSPETLGERLADECANERHILWNHALFLHNLVELRRLSESMRLHLLADE